MAKATYRPGVMAGLGGFGALFDLKAAGYRDPILVSGTDGVGTKLKVAITANRHETVGIDLVAMCVNDLLVQGAEPLFFLDYFATGRLEVEAAASVLAGIAKGCELAGCALIGGETAEMPGLYGEGDYDLAGFAVGAVERDQVLTGAEVAEGDLILALESDGLHSNGFSLVRRIIEDHGLDYAAAAPFSPEESLADALLRPTRIYARPCLEALKSGGIHGMAHITGGGLLENLPRVLPAGVAARIEANDWPLQPVFAWLAEVGKLPRREMLRTFNCGVGMILLVQASEADRLSTVLRQAGERVQLVGQIVASDSPEVQINAEALGWPA